MKNIIILVFLSIFSINSFSIELKNIKSSIKYERNDLNLVIFPSNLNHKYSLIVYTGKRKKMQKESLISHHDHLMATIPKDTVIIELRNETTQEFFNLK